MLNFIDRLDLEQAKNAEKVALAAKRAGVDPVLAVGIAYQESRLRSNPARGSSGEIGMMQVMPGTGRGMGFTETQLRNLDQNIEAGVQYLKKGLEATGNDPLLASIYYNGGPGAIQAMTQGKDPDPRVFDYLRSINSYGTFGPQPEAAAAPGAEPRAQSGAVPAEQVPGDSGDQAGVEQGNEEGPLDTAQSDKERDERINREIEENTRAQSRRMGQLIGAGTGAAISGYRLGKSAIKSAATALGEASETGRIAAQARAGSPVGGLPQAGPPGAPRAPSGAVLPSGPTQLGVPGTYPAATGPGSATYNYARAFNLPEIEALRAQGLGKGQGEVWDLQQKRQQALNQLQQMFPNERYIENPRYGGIMTPAPGPGSGVRQSFVSQPATPASPGQPAQAGGLRALPSTRPIPTAPLRAASLQGVTQDLRELARPLISGASALARYMVPPLALAGAGGEASDLESELRKTDPDYLKAGLSGLAAVSGLAALSPPAAVPAAVVGGSAALLNYLLQQQRERERTGVVTAPPPSIEYAAP